MKNLIDYLGDSYRPELYIYPSLEYSNCKEKIEFICKQHGPFIQRIEHHKRGSGCSECGKLAVKKARMGDITSFIEKANAVHSNKYSYENAVYTDHYTKLTITCPIHGDFEQAPIGHLRGDECYACGRIKKAKNSTKTTKQFIEEAGSVHGSKYDYSKFVYTGSHNNGIIVCHEHGEFSQQAATHLQGSGCPSCSITGFKKDELGILYLLQFKDEFNTQKIGITNRSVSSRYSKKDLDKVIIIREYVFEDGNKCYNAERDVLERFKEFKYTGKPLLFSGNTELINYDLTAYLDEKYARNLRVCQAWEHK